MGHFEAGSWIIVKMTKCRQVYTHMYADGSLRYPHGQRSKLPC